jgi:hypothetical protein
MAVKITRDQKRGIVFVDEEELEETAVRQDFETTAHSPSAPYKYARHDEPVSGALTHESGYLVVHRVTCHGERDHSKHLPLATYLDTPQLFLGDSKASTLRGQENLHDITEYLEDHPKTILIVYKDYSCETYFHRMKDDFARLPMPSLDPHLLSQIRNHFFILKLDGKPAKPYSEHMEIRANNLRDALSSVGIEGSSLQQMEAPYLEIFHHLPKLSSPITDINVKQKDALQTLLYYLQESWLNNFIEANALFAKGLVSLRHLSKLFVPGEVVILSDTEKPMGYCLDSCTALEDGSMGISSLGLKCWSWSFDGQFVRTKADLKVEWTFSDDDLPIVSLPVYPLKYAEAGLAERIRARGSTFWSCRKKRFVEYRPTNLDFQSRTVINRSIFW